MEWGGGGLIYMLIVINKTFKKQYCVECWSVSVSIAV